MSPTKRKPTKRAVPKARPFGDAPASDAARANADALEGARIDAGRGSSGPIGPGLPLDPRPDAFASEGAERAAGFASDLEAPGRKPTFGSGAVFDEAAIPSVEEPSFLDELSRTSGVCASPSMPDASNAPRPSAALTSSAQSGFSGGVSPAKRPSVRKRPSGADARTRSGEEGFDPDGRETEAAEEKGNSRRRVRRSRADKPAKKKSIGIRIAGAIASVLAIAVIVCFALFSWGRWFSHDDAADLQGTWYVLGTTTPITVTADSIELSPDAAYSYSVDPFAKSLTYEFGNLSGSGRYRFSQDRQTLAIIEGGATSWFDTLCEDLARFVDNAWRALTGQDPLPLVSGQQAIVITKKAPAGTQESHASPDETASAEGGASQSPSGLPATDASSPDSSGSHASNASDPA